MAVLALGGLGAIGGSLAGGFTIMQGLQIGMAVGSLLDATLFAPKPPDSKLSDLRYGGSSFGAEIARSWGRMRWRRFRRRRQRRPSTGLLGHVPRHRRPGRDLGAGDG